jgi:hypothetical protein
MPVGALYLRGSRDLARYKGLFRVHEGRLIIAAMLKRACDTEAFDGAVGLLDERDTPELVEWKQPAVVGMQHERRRPSFACRVVVVKSSSKASDVLH